MIEDPHEDFWGRRENAPQFQRKFRVFGWPVEMTSNHEGILAAADFSAPLYSTAPPTGRKAFRVQALVQNPIDEPFGSRTAFAAQGGPGPLPDDLLPHIQYTGSGDWIHLRLGAWGTCFAELRAGRAVAVLTPQLAALPEIVSRCLLNTLLNNFLTRNGYAMLHATGLVRGDRVLLLMAPHNTGKSTTALHLTLRRKFQLISDSQTYIAETGRGPQLTGFPVGCGKLRWDMLPHFPDLQGLLTHEQVRDESKYTLDLRQLDPDLVCDHAVYPSHIDLCLLSRSGRAGTELRQATLEEGWDAVMANSLHYDERPIWEANLRLIEPVLAMARLHHLEIGTDVGEMLRVVDSL